MDYGHKQADKMLKELEKRIQEEYRKASSEVEESMNKYLKNFYRNDTVMRMQLDAEVITEAEYLTWKQNAILTGKRWEALRDELTEVYVNADKVAYKMINDHSASVYALNFNYGTFEAETGAHLDTSFTLYNKEAVIRILKDDPKLLPAVGAKTEEAIRLGKATRWNEQQIQSVALQGILQGESMPKVAKRIADTVGTRDMVSAIRAARTLTTSAENGGRQDSYNRAKDYGIDMNKTWVTARDSHVRASHRELDGETVAYNDTFSNGLMFPGDPDGEPGEVYNCRCAMYGRVMSVNGIDISDLTEVEDEWDGDFDRWVERHETGDSSSGREYVEVESPRAERPSYYRELDAAEFVGETMTEEDVERINERFRALDAEWHAEITDIKTTLKRDQERYDTYYKNYVDHLLEENPRMRRSTAERRTLEMLGPRPQRADILKGGDFNEETKVMTLNNRTTAARGGIEEDIESRKRHTERNARRVADGKTERALGNVGDTYEGIFIHEYGHAVDTTYGITEDPRFVALHASYTESEIKHGVSGYATTNIKEFWSECFEESHMGETQGEMSKKAMEVARTIVEEKQ